MNLYARYIVQEVHIPLRAINLLGVTVMPCKSSIVLAVNLVNIVIEFSTKKDNTIGPYISYTNSPFHASFVLHMCDLNMCEGCIMLPVQRSVSSLTCTAVQVGFMQAVVIYAYNEGVSHVMWC